MSASGLPTETKSWPAARVGWYTIGILFIAYVFSFADRYVLSLLIQPIKQDLALSDTMVSLLHGLAFAIFYTFMGIPIGRLADRHSRRLIITLGIIAWSAMTALCGIAKSFWQLFVARIGVGVGEAALSPAASSIIADLFLPDQLGRALSVYSSGAMLGGGLAFIIGGIVIEVISSTPEVVLPFIGTMRSWQLSFLVVGLPGFAIAALMYTIKEPVRRTTSSKTASEVNMLPLGEVLAYLRSLLPVYGPYFVGFTMLALLFNAVLAWLPTFMLRAFDMPPGQSGPALGVLLLVFGSAGIVVGGWYADRLVSAGQADGTLRLGVIAGLGSSPFAIAAPLMITSHGTLLLCAPLFFFATSSFGAALAGLQHATPNRMRGVVVALYLFLGNLFALGMGPTLVALCTDFVFRSDAAVGQSISVVAGGASVLAALFLMIGMPAFRAHVGARLEAPRGPGRVACEP